MHGVRFHEWLLSSVDLPMQSVSTDAPAMRLATFVERDGPALSRYLGRLLGSADDAEDVLQDAVLRALRVASLPPGDELRRWLYRVATNRAIDVMRRRRTRPLDFDPASPSDLQRDTERAAVAATLREAASRLPPRQRAALTLRYLEDKPYPELAAVLGCTEQAARASVYQGLKRLRRDLAGMGDSL